MSNFSNTAKTMYLTAAITNVATTATVTNTPGGSVVNPSGYGWPSAPFYAEIDGDSAGPEIVKVTNNASGTLTIVRPSGQAWAYGSVPSAHSMNAPIVPVLTAADIADLANKSYVDSARTNLVINGNGELLDNTNFSPFTFDQSDAPTGLGAFSVSEYNTTKLSDTYIPVDTSKTYRFKYAVRQAGTAGASTLGLLSSYDIDQQWIGSEHCMFQAGTHTVLAQDLDPGDTVVHLASAANWQNAGGTATHLRGFIFWGYTNSKGYTYPDYTYSRKVLLNAYAEGAVNYGANTITLTNPWPSTWGTIPAGTKVSNSSAGNTYNYIPNTAVIPTSTYQTVYGEIGGIDTSGTNNMYRFRPGTAYVRVGWLVNLYVAGSVMKYANISLSEVSSGQLRTFEKFDTATSGIDWFQIKNTGSTPALSVDVANNRIGINKTSPSYALDVAGSALFSGKITVGSDPTGDYEVATKHYVDTYGGGGGGGSPLDPDLTAIANLVGTSGYLKKTAADTWSLDTSTFLTSNQTITLSGDASGSGTTSINVVISDDSHNHTSATISNLDAGDTTTGIFDIARIPTGTTGSTVALGNHTHSYQPADNDLTAIAGLSGTGYLRRTGTDTWTLDTSPGTGNVVGPGTSTDNAIARYDGTSGTSIQDSLVTIDDTGVLTAVTFSGSGSLLTGIPQSAISNLTVDLGYKAGLASPAFTGTPTAPTAAVDTNTTQIATTEYVIAQGYLKSATAASTYQPVDGDLTAIAAVSGTGYLRRTGADTWTLDTPATATWGGITGTLSSQTDLQNALNAKQAADNDLTAIAALAGTSGFLKKTATDTWTLDTANYLPTSGGTVSGEISFSDDGEGISFYGSARIYKRIGSGITIKRHSSDVDPMVENAAGNAWYKIWHEGNDGASSGLDADTLDGSHASAFALSGHNHSGTYQPLDGDLTAIAALSGTGFLRRTGTDTWTLAAAGTGDVVGPASATDNAIAVYDGTTGKLIQDSLLTVSDAGKLNTVASASGGAGLNIPHGTAPSSPTNGDMWTTNSGVYARINGVTQGPFESAAGTYQPASGDLTAIDALVGTSGFLKKTATDTWTLDTSTYLTANQTITLSGDATGSGTTAITVTVADDSHSHTSSTISALDAGDVTTGTFAIGRIPTGTTGTTVALGNHTHSYQPLDADLTAIAGLAGTSGLLKKTAADTWTLDTNTYITGNQTITLSGVVTGSGTTTITTAFAASPTFTGTVTIPTLDLTTAATTSVATSYWVETGSDGIVRPKALANVQSEIVTTTTVNAAAATTVGTVTTGTWNATAIADNKIASALTGKTYNGLTLTAAATGFTIAGGTTSKTLTVSNTLTLSGTDSSTLNIGGGGTLGTAAYTASTAYLSSSTSSTQAGYFGDIYLYDDSTPSHYLQVTNSANLTAARLLNVNVNDADRTISLSGNLTVSSAATISGTNTGDQTITLTGDVTGSGTGSFAATIANDAVTYAKMQNISAQYRVLGRISAAAGDTEELTGENLVTVLGQATSKTGSGSIVFHTAPTFSGTVTASTIAPPSGYLALNYGSGAFDAVRSGQLQVLRDGVGDWNTLFAAYGTAAEVTADTPRFIVYGLGAFEASHEGKIYGTGSAYLKIDGGAGSERQVQFQTAGSLRWTFGATNSAESGSNAGSNFSIARYSDAGAWIDNPFEINRNDGVASIKSIWLKTGGKIDNLPTPTASTEAASKGYVDTALALKAPLASPTFTGTVATDAAGTVNSFVAGNVGTIPSILDGSFVANRDSHAIIYLLPHGSSGIAARLRGYVAGGTAASRTVPTASSLLMSIDARGWGGTGYRGGAGIEFSLGTGTFSDTSMPGKIEFQTVPDGSVIRSTRLTIDQNGMSTFNGNVLVSGTNKLYLGTATGGFKGEIRSQSNYPVVLMPYDNSGNSLGSAEFYYSTGGNTWNSEVGFNAGGNIGGTNATTGTLSMTGSAGDALLQLVATGSSGNYAYNKLLTKYGQASQNELHTGLGSDGSWFVSQKTVNGSSVSRDNRLAITNAGVPYTTYTVSTSDASTTLVTKAYADANYTVFVQNTTNPYTFALSDAGKSIEMNASGATTFTIPLNSAVAFPVGTVITVWTAGTGQCTINGTAGVTINATPQGTANTAKLRTQWSSATLIKRFTDQWIVIGDLIA